jgi:nucleoside phosphorylase
MLSQRTDIGVLTVISAELEATLTALNIRKDADREKQQDGTIYWRGRLPSHLKDREYSIVLSCIGSSGNYDSAAAATTLIKEYRPKVVILVGIAAGIRGLTKIGEVVISDRVVAYEPAALEKKGRKAVEIPRPEMPRIEHPLEQDVVSDQVRIMV